MDSKSFRLGEISLGLELLSVMRAFEDRAVGTALMDLQREEVCAMLQTILTEADLLEEVMGFYVALVTSRRLIFQAVSDDAEELDRNGHDEPSSD